MLLAGAQTLGLGSLRDLGRRCEVGTVTTVSAAAAATASPIAATTTVVAAATTVVTAVATLAARAVTTAGTGATITPVATTGTIPATGPIAATGPVATVAITARSTIVVTPQASPAVVISTAATRGTVLDDGLEGLVARQQFEQLARGLLLGRHHRQHVDAVEILLDLDPQLITDAGARRHDGAIEHPARVLRAGRPPCPRTVPGRARQLDLDARGHGPERYRYRRAMPIYALGSQVPDIDAEAYVHPDAVVIGSVRIGPGSSIWPGAVLRGDDGAIVIGARTSVQDNSVLHTTPDDHTTVGDDCVIGHIVHLEGCIVKDRAMVGNASIVLHRSVVGHGAVVAANSVVLYDVNIPDGALAVGAPATIKPGRARPEDIVRAAASYVARAQRFASELRRVD